ncbi:MAG: OmpA family protein [Gammaproteobacteria bacterium]|nr:OmpA family protein [Gammaproteobacteria bacterium]
MRLFSKLVKVAVFSSFTLSGAAVADESTGTARDILWLDVNRSMLIQSLLPVGTAFFDDSFVGREGQIGEVNNFDFIGIDKGMVLSNGYIEGVVGPNVSDYTSNQLSSRSNRDADFQALNGGQLTRDAAILEFSFKGPDNSNGVDIKYVFGSDEYGADTENLAEGKHDFMAIFVNGQNCAVTSGEKVGVSTVNSEVNADLYIANYRDGENAEGSEFNVEMDGFTKVLTCHAPLKAGEDNTVKVGIVDASDEGGAGKGNSWVILESITPTFLLDQDGDGIPDVVEGTYDVDGDGIPNNLDLDSDGDGGSDFAGQSKSSGGGDRSECDYEQDQECLSADGDSIPDFLDPDDQGPADGNGGDSDGDGFSDSEECPDYSAGCPDPNGNNIPAYNDPKELCSSGPTQCRGLDPEDNTPSPSKVQAGLNGNGSLDGGLLFVLAAAAGLRLRKKKINRSEGFAALLSLPVLALGLGGNVQPAYADSTDKLDDVYFGAGVGNSWLEPNAKNSAYSLHDDADMGFKLLAGYDLGTRLGLELSYVDLGSAVLGINTPQNEMDYKTASLAGLFHVLGERSKSIFVKAGVSKINVSGGVPVDMLNDYQVMIGVGGEWAVKNNWSLRAEFESFDEDAKIATLGIVKRFQSKRVTEHVETVPVIVEKEEEICSDVTSVADTGCYIPPVAEQKDDCKVLTGGVEGIHFELNSAELTIESIPVLNNVVNVLEACPSVVLEVQAYADSIGREEANLSLSNDRAHAVKLYLASRGISPPRLVAVGYGESNPVASNSTAAGQALNRRVDFQVLRIISAD